MTYNCKKCQSNIVTILILIDGFLQCKNTDKLFIGVERHNPYFNRWFSAILEQLIRELEDTRHNPYFNRWFSAIYERIGKIMNYYGHNPYFNRWFSAIELITR